MPHQVKIAVADGLNFEVAARGKPETLRKLTPEEAQTAGEEQIQLLEGASYDYCLNEGYSLTRISKITQTNSFNSHQGTITPGIYVGRLVFTIEKDSNDETNKVGKTYSVAVEVRSTKADYRTEYRNMLEDITNECAELLMIHSSPVTQRYSIDHSTESQTLYQKFALIKSLIDSDEFHHAVHRVIAMPVTKWTNQHQHSDMRRARRIGSKQARQIASASDRVALPAQHPLRSRLSSIPRTIEVQNKVDTVDTPENRFIKHVLQEFERFCGLICQHIERKEKDGSQRPNIYQEAKILENQFSEHLSHNIFHQVSNPTSLPLNSPVLQRKSGYREILRTWLMFDLAGKLSWEALTEDHDNYHAGKRDVATLYEYWLFFKLLRLVESIFDIPKTETKDLIAQTSDGLGLQLKAGQAKSVKGELEHNGRKLKVKYCFNRTFSPAEYPHGGSWTQQMRPDYTISIWPADFSEREAERQELIIHVHFDAKYKVEDLLYLDEGQVEPKEHDHDSEKLAQKQGNYKRADLLKMHAYKDAIRRTVGAYVLYPGSKKYNKTGFHEIVPGLGAFPISPSRKADSSNQQLQQLKEFIKSVLEHFTNRASQRERLSYYQYDVHKDGKSNEVQYASPEYAIDGEQRAKPPRDSSVLIGYYNKEQYDWIEKKGLYNIRLDPDKGLVNYGSKAMNAKLLLLYTGNNRQSAELWRIESESPALMSDKELLAKDYPRKTSSQSYFVYEVSKFEDLYDNCTWDISKLPEFKANKRPFATSMKNFMKTRVNQRSKG